MEFRQCDGQLEPGADLLSSRVTGGPLGVEEIEERCLALLEENPGEAEALRRRSNQVVHEGRDLCGRRVHVSPSSLDLGKEYKAEAFRLGSS
jgi:hypothetical protein